MARAADDPIALRSAFLVRAFTRYLQWYVTGTFHAVRVSKAGLPQPVVGRPLIVYLNHPGWWDPVSLYLISADLLPARACYGPMEQSALQRYAVFRRLGLFGIDSQSPRGAVKFLSVSQRVLADPANVLWITAEGYFSDPRRRPVRLRPGLAHLARRVPDAVILPLALEYAFWHEKKPEALARFGPPVAAEADASVDAWTRRLEAGLTETMDALAAESIARDPSAFTVLRRGSVGIGGPYDWWRRARALAAGRRFDPSHEGGQ